jgi:hypothetical protein
MMINRLLVRSLHNKSYTIMLESNISERMNKDKLYKNPEIFENYDKL